MPDITVQKLEAYLAALKEEGEHYARAKLDERLKAVKAEIARVEKELGGSGRRTQKDSDDE